MGCIISFRKHATLCQITKNCLRILTYQQLLYGENDPFLKWQPQAEQVRKDLKIKPESIHLINAKHFIQETYFNEIVNIATA